MLKKKIWILLIMSILTSCCARKTVVVAPEYNVIMQDQAAALREEFNKIIGNKVHFAFDSSVLSSEAKNRLEKQAQWLLAHPVIMATIEGHCDERGSREYNNALGLRRAEAVRNFLITRGVGHERLATVSYGKDKPEAASHNIDAWKLNRRAVSVIIEVL
jgi:peptidoglycan-associated lipoprotein